MTTHGSTNRRAFLNCWVSRNLGVVSLSDQALATAVESTPPPSTAEEIAVIPSLYGLQLGAPYLHHGQAASLEDLLDPGGRWTEHLRSGNAVFLVDDPTGADRADLINFLLSIDADATEIPLPTGFDACPSTFP